MQVNVLKTREEFASHKKSLFESGALREIFVAEKATVYSLADSCYGIVFFVQKPAEGNQYYLLHCGLDDIELYIKNENILPDMFKVKLDRQEVYNFDSKYDAALEKMNQRRIETGFTRIDLDAEKNMLFDLQQKAAKQQKFFRRKP